MRKNFTFLILLIALFVCFSTNSNIASQTTNSSPKVQLSLEKKQIYNWCPWGNEYTCSKNELKIQVKTLVEAIYGNNNLNYIYTVSGGSIVGTGEYVFWDFEKVRPGNYTISVEVNDGKSLLIKSEPQTVQLAVCPACDPPCNCPTITVTPSSENPKPGDTITFTANLEGVTPDLAIYKWTLSSGFEVKVESNQPTIKIRTTPEMSGSYITATVEVGGLCADCQNTVSTTVQLRR